ncbi:MAG TPA: hypothetical protein VGL83_10210 [Stellaceae bacterium]|jgi:hypothetical protein
MRSLLVLAVISLGLTACVDVHNPPPQAQPNTVVVPPTASGTTTIICPAGAASC